MSAYDTPWKEALAAYFEPFLAFFFPAIHADIDWSKGYETLDKELQQVIPEAELGDRLADMLVRVWRKDGSEKWVLIHVEVQSQPEADFGKRMYVYNYRIFNSYNQAVVSLAILGDERRDWRPNRHQFDLWGCRLDFVFPVVKLLDYETRIAELEAAANPFAVVVLAHLASLQTRQDPQARYGRKIRLMRELYERGWERGEIERLLRFLDWMLDLPEALAATFRQEVYQLEQEKRMPYVTSFERLSREEGRVAGRTEGLQEARWEAIELGLELRFGAEGLQLLPAVRQMQDVERLRTILQAIKTVAHLDELRQLISQEQKT